MKVFEGSRRYLEAAADAGLADRGRLLQREHPGGPRGHRAGPVRAAAGRRRDDPRAAPARQAGPRLVPAAARERLDVAPDAAAVFEDALGRRPGRAGRRLRVVVGVDRVGHADALRSNGADVVVADLADLEELPVIEQGAFPVEPWHVRETRLDLDLIAQSESVFALSNGHIGLRGNLDEGEPHGLPGTYLNSFYETRPLPYAEAGLRLPRGRPDAGRRHQRQGDPAAGRRRAVRRPVRRAARARAGPRPARRHAAPHRALALPRRQAGRGSPRPGWCRFDPAQRRRDRVRRRGGRRVHPGHGAVRAGRQRGPAGDVRATRGSPRCWTGRWSRSMHETAEQRRGAAAPHPGQRADDGRRHGPRGRGAGPGRGRDRRRDGLGAHHRHLRAAARAAAAHREVPGLRVVEPALAARAARPGGRRAGRRALHRLAGPAGRAARLPRRLLGRRRRRGRGRRGHPAGGAVRAVPRAAGQRPRRASRDRRQGPDRPRLRRARLLGHRGIRAAGADLHRAGGRRRRAALAARRRWTWPATAPRSSACKGAAFPWRTIRGQECSAYWPAGTAAWHVNADIADGVRALPRWSPGPTTSSASAGWRCWSRRPGCGCRWATTTGTASGTSTASPARTSTPRSSATTSSPT